MVNIIPLSKVKDCYHVTYGSEGEGKFIVHKMNYHVEFIKSLNGLYYHGMSDMPMSFAITTIKGNRKILTRKEYKQTVAAQKLYLMVGQPSVADFNNMVKFNLLPVPYLPHLSAPTNSTRPM
eukprot:9753236-Ditylum_brightwellii.AAC.1